MQILKFERVDSFAYGDNYLIYFEEIRKYLRNRLKDKKLVLKLNLISLGADEMNLRKDPSKVNTPLMRQKTSLIPESNYSQSFDFPPLIE